MLDRPYVSTKTVSVNGGDQAADPVGILLGNVAEQVVGAADDVREPLQFGFGSSAGTIRRDRVDLGVPVGKADVLDRLLFHQVAVHVDRFNDALRKVVFTRHRSFGIRKVRKIESFSQPAFM